MRTLNRAERVHQAMLCRGFNGEVRLANSRHLRVIDGIFFIFWISYFLLFRLFNFPQWLGALLTGR
jgi:cobalt/nickel transport system permease protein